MSRTEVVIFPHIMWPMLCWQIPDRMQYLCVVSHTELTDVWQITVLLKSCKPCSAGKCLTGYSTSCIVSHVDLTHRSPYLMCCEPCWADKYQTDYSTSCVVSHVELTNMRQITVPHVLWAMLIWVWQTCDRLQYYMCCEPCYDVPKVLRDMSSWQMSDRLQYLMCCEPCWADKHLTDYST